MSYRYVPEMKEPFVCETECSHPDCRAAWLLVRSICRLCSTEIGVDVKVTMIEIGPDKAVVHYSCALADAGY